MVGEELERGERLKQMVIGGVIDNKSGSSGGYECKGSKGKIISGLDEDFQNLDVLAFKVKSFGSVFGINVNAPKGESHVLLVPLDSFANSGGAEKYLGVRREKAIFGKGKIIKPWQDGTVAIIFSNYALKLDPSNRDGNLGGCVLMSAENTKKFQAELEMDPRVLFDLARAVNGGSIKRFDNQPAEIVLGKNVTILPNAEFGGEVSQRKQTADFPAGYNPNQLF